MKILLIEDDVNIRKELQILLENALYETKIIENFTYIVEQILEENPDLILLDVNLPNNSGLVICTELRKVSDIPIIFVTSNNTSMDELNCMMLGGDDYVTKPYNAPVLLARIAALIKRTKKANIQNRKQEENKIVYKEITLNVETYTVKYREREIELTKNEFKILHYLFRHTKVIVSRLDIVEFLWDNEVFIDDNTLSVNITRIRNKLEQIGVTDLIETKRGLGYKI